LRGRDSSAFDKRHHRRHFGIWRNCGIGSGHREDHILVALVLFIISLLTHGMRGGFRRGP
jgi:hypothetical protein